MYMYIHSQLSISSVLHLKIQPPQIKNIQEIISRKFWKAKLKSATWPKLFINQLHCVSITSNLEMIQSMWEDMIKIFGNTKLLFIGNLNIFRFWYLQGALETILHRYRGTIVINISINNSQPQTSDSRLHCLSRTMFLISPLWRVRISYN